MIEIKDLNYKYGEKENLSLKGINLSVKNGEAVLLCGKSGCGKSTLLKFISGIISNFYEDGFYSGSIKIDDIDVMQTSLADLCRKVGTVFQNPRTQFYTSDTTSEIAFGLENLAENSEYIKKRVEQVFKDLNIEELRDRNIFKLSGGEKQKIAIASIYAINPDVYVLDEPSANLDPFAVKELHDILLLLKKQGKTIIIAEHRIYYLKDIIDRAIYINNGQILNEYSIDDLRNFDFNKHFETGIRPIDLKNFYYERNFEYFGKEKLTINLLLKYSKKTVLNIKELEVNNGRIITIVGKNGAGKTTFMKSLSGLNKKVRGKVFINENKVSMVERLKKSYMILQDVNHQLFASSVLEEVTLNCKNIDNEQLEKLLKDLNLWELKDKHPATLSGGQKQRVAIASAIFCSKKILFFDEPTSGLDFTNMIKTVKLINELKKQGYFIFLITHDYEFLHCLSDEIIVLESGIVKQDYYYFPATFNKIQCMFCFL